MKHYYQYYEKENSLLFFNFNKMKKVIFLSTITLEIFKKQKNIICLRNKNNQNNNYKYK